jgi:hypothetical protein
MQSTIIRLTDSVRELFKKMSFPEIPEAAKFIVFSEDGEAQFLEDFQMSEADNINMTTFIHFDVADLEIVY